VVQQYLIRSATTEDIVGLDALANVPGMYNLPSQRERLKVLLERSQGSFDGSIEHPLERSYVFVLEDLEKGALIGTSQVIAQHGSKTNPHIFMERFTEEYYSASIDTFCSHEALRLGFEHHGPTELGGLVLNEGYRHVPEKLGRQLSYVRFMLIAMFKQLFSDRLIAEMLPPMGPDERNVFWESIAGRFIPLSYHEADALTRKDKEFVKTLLPRGPFYIGLLSQSAREAIGAVAPGAKAAYKLLVSLGFKDQGKIDPFDGGPYLEANTSDITMLQHVLPWTLSPLDEGKKQQGQKQTAIWAAVENAFSPKATFRAAQSSFWAGPKPNTALVEPAVIELLGTTEVTGLVLEGRSK